MELNYVQIGERILNLRKSQGLKQYVFAERCGISPQHLCEIETAHTKMSLSVFVSICNALGVTADSVLCDVVAAAGERCKDENISVVFDDATPEETRLMLAMSNALKTTLRKDSETYRKNIQNNGDKNNEDHETLHETG